MKIIEDIKYFLCHFKWYYQRIKYGVADRDIWSFDYSLSTIIIIGLLKMRKYKSGTPQKLTLKKWHRILGKIIWTFCIARKVISMDVILYYNKKQYLNDVSLSKDFQINNSYYTRVFNKNKTKKFYEGFDLFKKYFFDLWT